MDNNTLAILIKQNASKVFDQYNQIFSDNKIEIDEIKFKFNLRGAVAGRAFYQGRELSFNLILAKDNLTDFLNSTVPHEVAHLFQRKIYPYSKPHGKEWKKIMQLGGYNQMRCHSYDTSTVKKVQTKKYEYGCKCFMRHLLTKNRHSRILNGSKYFCNVCHSEIYFLQEIS